MKGAMALVWACGLAAAGCGSDGAPTVDGGGGLDGADAAADAIAAGDPAGACGQVQPCGGDVVGTWTFVENCESAASVASIKASFAAMAAGSWCPSQTLVGVEPAASGTLELDAAGGYALALVFGGHLDIDFPASCIAPASCDDAAAGFQSQIEMGLYPMPNVTSITCSGPSNCVCRAMLERPQTESGTYTIAGSVLSFSVAPGAVTNKSYCAGAGRLHILKTSTGPAGQTLVDSDLLATKP